MAYQSNQKRLLRKETSDMKEKKRICFYLDLKRKNQSKRLMVIKEWYIGKEVTFAKILLEI